MRDIPFVDEFHAVINIFTAFGYFETDAENELVLHQVHKALRRGQADHRNPEHYNRRHGSYVGAPCRRDFPANIDRGLRSGHDVDS